MVTIRKRIKILYYEKFIYYDALNTACMFIWMKRRVLRSWFSEAGEGCKAGYRKNDGLEGSEKCKTDHHIPWKRAIVRK